MGKCLVADSLFRIKDTGGHEYSSFLEKTGEYSVRCRICACELSTERCGSQAIYQHLRTEKHKTLAVGFFDTTQLRIGSPSSSTIFPAKPEVYNLQDAATHAEVRWALKVVASNYSTRSCIVPLFNDMFCGEVFR